MNEPLIEKQLLDACGVVPAIQPSCAFGITSWQRSASPAAHAMAAWPAAALKQASPESTPPCVLRGVRSHIGGDREKVGVCFDRKLFADDHRVGGEDLALIEACHCPQQVRGEFSMGDILIVCLLATFCLFLVKVDFEGPL